MARHRKTDPASGLSRDALETLLDLVEIRLGCVEVYDREDVRELRQLERTRDQLVVLLGAPPRPPMPRPHMPRAPGRAPARDEPART